MLRSIPTPSLDRLAVLVVPALVALLVLEALHGPLDVLVHSSSPLKESWRLGVHPSDTGRMREPKLTPPRRLVLFPKSSPIQNSTSNC